MFHPGGLYDKNILIGGEVAVYSWTPKEQPLYSSYVRLMTKGFVGIPDWCNRKWWVGPEALEMLRSGGRLLTGSVDAPDTYEDIKLPENLKT
jgi:hypothetical protein